MEYNTRVVGFVKLFFFLPFAFVTLIPFISFSAFITFSFWIKFLIPLTILVLFYLLGYALKFKIRDTSVIISLSMIFFISLVLNFNNISFILILSLIIFMLAFNLQVIHGLILINRTRNKIHFEE